MITKGRIIFERKKRNVVPRADRECTEDGSTGPTVVIHVAPQERRSIVKTQWGNI